MDKENNLVKVQDENGKTFDMLILNEFKHKNKKYAILTEIDACHCDDCDCDETCDCGCQEGEECTCKGECHCECHEKSNCDEECECGCQDGKECTCEEECHCGCHDGCHCDDEPMLCLLEITKDKDGNEVFKSIDDEKLFNELVEKADKVLYED